MYDVMVEKYLSIKPLKEIVPLEDTMNSKTNNILRCTKTHIISV